MKTIKNILDYIPVANANARKDDEGRFILCVARFKNRFALFIGRLLKQKEMISYHLDETGSRVWSKIDGNHTIEEIGREMFGSAASENDFIKLSIFIGDLYKRGCIFLNRPIH